MVKVDLSMSNQTSLIERVLAGDVLLEDLDDAIDAAVGEWHRADTSKSLPLWLGMTEEEYALWLEQPDIFCGRLLDVKVKP